MPQIDVHILNKAQNNFCKTFIFRLSFLEEDKYDYEVKHDFLKQELKQHRQRVNDLMGAKAKGKINTRK